jgi:hypothetical protein
MSAGYKILIIIAIAIIASAVLAVIGLEPPIGLYLR